MRSPYQKLEIGIGIAGLLAATAVLVLGSASRSFLLADLFRYLGVLLLAQGFVRDVYLLSSGRGRGGEAEARRGWYICAESTLGLALIAQGLFLAALGVAARVTLPAGVWVLLLAAWWLFGYATREVVFEMRRDPDHLNLLVGPRKRGSAHGPLTSP